MKLKPTFEQSAGELARIYALDAHEIKEVYEGRPDSLEAHFNAVSGAQEEKAKYLKHTVISGIAGFIFVPIWVYTAYAAYKMWESDDKIKAVGNSLRGQIDNYRQGQLGALPPPAPPAA